MHRLLPFDWAMLIPYFSVLIILSIFGMHRYAMIRGYMKHSRKFTGEPPSAFHSAAAHHRPAPPV